MKKYIYRYHIVLRLDGKMNFHHSFDSDSEILKSSEIRAQLAIKGLSEEYNEYTVIAINKTIND